MTKIHVMLDIETWGKTPGCDIRSIGACVFDPINGLHYSEGYRSETNGTFYVACDNPLFYAGDRYTPEQLNALQFGRRYNLTRDPDTVKWWSEQSAEAQAAFENSVDLRQALIHFAVWLESLQNTPVAIRYPDIVDIDELRLWANDPHFDCSILAAAYHAVGLPEPWHYRSPRSVKTVCDLAGLTREDYCNYGEAHNALDDAIAQSMTVCKAYERLGLRK